MLLIGLVLMMMLVLLNTYTADWSGVADDTGTAEHLYC